MANSDYPYIAAWGRFLHSFDYYVKDEQYRAKIDGAPQDAIYKRDGKWVRFGEITNPTTKRTIENIVKELTHA